jgi:hypothetical protein
MVMSSLDPHMISGLVGYEYDLKWFFVNIKVCVTSSVLSEHKSLWD